MTLLDRSNQSHRPDPHNPYNAWEWKGRGAIQEVGTRIAVARFSTDSGTAVTHVGGCVRKRILHEKNVTLQPKQTHKASIH